MNQGNRSTPQTTTEALDESGDPMEAAASAPEELVESAVGGFEAGEEISEALPGGDPARDTTEQLKSPLEKLPQTTGSLSEFANRSMDKYGMGRQ